jgi:tetratricopeptide (TPR) repeat protein
MMGRHGETLERATRAMETAQRFNFGFVAAMAASILGGRVNLLDPGPARAVVEHGLTHLGGSQSPIQRALLMSAHAETLGMSGDLAALRKRMPEVQDYGLGEERARVYVDWRLTEVRLREKIEQMRAGGAFSQVAALSAGIGWIRELEGDESGAREGYSETIERCQNVGDLLNVVLPRLRLAVLEATRGDLPAAEAQLAAAREIIDGPEDHRGLVGVLARVDAVVAAARGDWATATKDFERSREILQHFGVPFEEAETHLAWGNALLRSGDRRRAPEQFDRALEIYRRIDADSQWLERTLAMKMRAQGSESTGVKASIAIVAASVEAKRPNLSMAVGTDGMVTLMFSDMYDYTGMMERLGDREALRDQDKFFGKTVIHAFRVADLAQADEILISEQLKDLIEDRGFRFGNQRDVTLKGFSGQHRIISVGWR